MQKRILEFFSRASGHRKEEATEELRKGCHALFAEIGGESKAREIEILLQREELESRIERIIKEMIDTLEDPEEKAQARMYVRPCALLYGVHVSHHDQR